MKYFKKKYAMTKEFFIAAVVSSMMLGSCKQSTQTTSESQKDSISVSEQKTDLLIGAWVEPNPINAKEMQGFELMEDSVAQSINMATLVYRKWWKEDGKLVLVAESLGNGMTISDTAKYEVVKITEQELELKDADYLLKYKRQ